MRRRYADRLSGPIRDRIDIHRTLSALSRPELANALGGNRSTTELAGLVAEARQRQSTRLGGTPWSLNSAVPGVELRKHWPVSDGGRALIDAQMRSLLINEFGIDPARLVPILHYDGTPITARFIAREIRAHVGTAKVTPIGVDKVASS